MATVEDDEPTLEDVGELSVPGWMVVDRDESEIELASEDRKDKITIKTVSLQNDEVSTGYLIEYHEGDEPYARWRDRTDSVIAPDPELVQQKVTELIETQ